VLDAEPLERPADQPERRRVSLDETEDVIPRAQLGDQAGGDRGGPRAGRDAVVALLQLREQQLELARRRVCAARVEIAFALAAVEAQRLLEALEGELDRLLDRRDQRAVVRRQRSLRRVIDARAALHRVPRRRRGPVKPA
jgi:hypothetical protein